MQEVALRSFPRQDPVAGWRSKRHSRKIKAAPSNPILNTTLPNGPPQQPPPLKKRARAVSTFLPLFAPCFLMMDQMNQTKATGTSNFNSGMRRLAGLGLICFVLSALASVPRAAGDQLEVDKYAMEGVWFRADGTPSPLVTTTEVEAFLSEAKVISWERIGTGVTEPKKVLLEKDGLQMHAIFRSVDIHKQTWHDPNAGPRLNFRDSCFYECAAYQLSKMLGLRNVPPVVRRKLKGKTGTLQIWIENTMMEIDRLKNRIMPPDTGYWSRQHRVLKLFDQLIYNDDRNLGNILIDKDWKLWFIDHTRAFRSYGDLPEATQILSCERVVWERLVTLDSEEIWNRLDPYLRKQELEGLLERRAQVVDRLTNLIEQKGEESVIFTIAENRYAQGGMDTLACSHSPDLRAAGAGAGSGVEGTPPGP